MEHRIQAEHTISGTDDCKVNRLRRFYMIYLDIIKTSEERSKMKMTEDRKFKGLYLVRSAWLFHAVYPSD